ncbi:PAS domain S-box-containing protein [Methanolinea mesophila]|uniref:sensor histidine kinase n=1 Tax=Methanolinea mesophila TaxID=547055 RepID=UPI001AE5598E|nr:ATP-binding protein [Methanolinea mesophila]MBP1928011.1 PAS domain S-box-containing protein [Methanolinea mesophila]
MGSPASQGIAGKDIIAGFRNLSGRARLQLFIVIVITAAALTASLAGILHGISLITPLLLFIPIAVAAYWFPRQGVIFAVFLGVLEVLLVFLYDTRELAILTFAVTTASFYVLVAIAVVISSLSGGLRERESRYHGIFDHSETGIFLVRNGDRGLQIMEVNNRGAEMVKEDPAALVGTSLSEVWKENASREEFLEKIKEDRSVSGFESALNPAKGGNVPVLVSGARLPGSQIVLTFTDISRRKQYEQQFQSRNLQLSTINQVIGSTSGATSVRELTQSAMGKIAELLGFEYCGCRLSGTETHGEEVLRQGDDSLYRGITRDESKAAKEWLNSIEQQVATYYPEPGKTTSEPSLLGAGAVIPLVSDDGPLGAMYFATRRPHEFTPDEKDVLESLGTEVGTAITKIRLSEDLAVANQRANLYLDILMHDINNANLASLWYGDLLTEMLSGEARDIARKMIEGIQKSREVIRNLETIRKIYERRENLKSIDLDRVIKAEMAHYPDARIRYEGKAPMVLADDLAGEIFTNLFGNSLKFGGRDVAIEVGVSERGDDDVVISVSDHGPGIPDELKEVIFNRFQTSTTKGSGKGLGLYIVKTLVERYGGKIWLEDVVPGDHHGGCSFQFTLKRAI